MIKLIKCTKSGFSIRVDSSSLNKLTIIWVSEFSKNQIWHLVQKKAIFVPKENSVSSAVFRFGSVWQSRIHKSREDSPKMVFLFYRYRLFKFFYLFFIFCCAPFGYFYFCYFNCLYVIADIHPVYGAGVRTHNLLIMSHLP